MDWIFNIVALKAASHDEANDIYRSTNKLAVDEVFTVTVRKPVV